MPTMYDEEYMKAQEQQKKIIYGNEYDELMKIRKKFADFKRILGQICPPHEAMLRHKSVFKQKGNPDNQKHVAVL